MQQIDDIKQFVYDTDADTIEVARRDVATGAATLVVSPTLSLLDGHTTSVMRDDNDAKRQVDATDQLRPPAVHFDAAAAQRARAVESRVVASPIVSPAPSPPLAPKHRSLCRSLSDSALDQLVRIVDQEEESTGNAATVEYENSRPTAASRQPTRPRRARGRRSDRRLGYEKQRGEGAHLHDDHSRFVHIVYINYNLTSCSYSSADDKTTMELAAKQLRWHRDHLVQYKPPRTNIAAFSARPFRRFGLKEIQAIAEFDYLQDVSTDVSNFASSPDPSPHP